MDTDRIQKQILLRAPRERVWHALSDSAQFGRWFGVTLDGPFSAGQVTRGRIVPNLVDAEVAAAQQPYEGMACDFFVETVEPMQRFSFRWHPGAEPDLGDPMTLVVFELKDAPGGTLLTITESGFDRIPLARRAKAFADNDEGWTLQARLIEKFLASAANAGVDG